MNPEIVDSFAQMAKEKGIDKDVLTNIVEEIFGVLIKKKYGEDANFDVVVNMDRGDIELYLVRDVVEEVENPNLEISIDELNSRGNEEELEVGEEFVEVLRLETFGRRLINLAKQSLNQRIRELEKDIIYNEYKELEGEIVIGDIYQIRKHDILVNHNKNELLLPRTEQIPFERYRKGDTVRAIVKEVNKAPTGPQVVISRTDNLFLQRLFEIEIPEIYDGVIEIKGIAREPGERAKVSVESQDKRIDAVGACVGMKGVRIHAIVRELNNENIDVVNFSNDDKVLIQRALAPGKIKKIEINPEERKATVYADSDQASQLVGRNGVNIRLAMKLTGYYIDLIREEKPLEEYEDDIELIDLRDDLGEEIYQVLINNRFDTAVEVLQAGEAKLKEIPELYEEKVKEIIEIIKSQFEEE
jgi:N utilization substance protein A